MTTFDLANEIMADALDVPAAGREEFVQRVCGEDLELRHEVTLLLDLYDAAGDLLDEPAVRPGRLAAGDLVAGRYRVLRELGCGGMGAVYEVEEPGVPGALALKTLAAQLRNDAEAMARFRAEFRAARGVSHPNVCPVFELLETDGMPAFTMALLPGEALAERMARGRLPMAEARAIARGVAAGLDALHAAGIVHHDLKPGNIVLADGVPVIMDFGLSATDWNCGPAGPETQRSAIEGSPDYMAPERFRNAAAGPAADIYAFGLILFEMATGYRPFPVEDLLPAVLRRSMEDAPRLSECGGPERWDQAIARALSRDPGARQRSAGDVLSEMT